MSASAWAVEVTRQRPFGPWVARAGWIKEIWLAGCDDEAAAVAAVAAACEGEFDANFKAVRRLSAEEATRRAIAPGQFRADSTLLAPSFERSELDGLLELISRRVERERMRLRDMEERVAWHEAEGSGDKFYVGATLVLIEKVLAAQVAERDRIAALLNAPG